MFSHMRVYYLNRCIWFILFSLILVNCGPITNTTSTTSHHHHNQFIVENCDDTINGIGIDWNGNDTVINEKNYLCDTEEKISSIYFEKEPFAKEFCRTPPLGYHVCLDTKLTYEDQVPIGGPHRPVWVTYGEYLFMPPQRWIHAIEHGAAAFLYNPCADPKEIEYFKYLAKNCLRRHIITPYKNLPKDQMFNIVTYGCKLQLNKIFKQEKQIASFLRRHAIKDGPEFHITEDGSYNFGLIEQAKIISDLKDSKICQML